VKILHINTNDNGGAAIAATRLHYLLLEKGIDSKILFLKRSGTVHIKEAYYFEDIFVGKLYFKLLLKLNSIYNRRFTFYKSDIYFNGPDSLLDITGHALFKWADIIHLHWVVKFLDWKKVFKNPSKKFIWTFHDMNPFTGGEHYQTGYNGEFPMISKRNIRKKINSVKNTDLTVITPSDWLRNIVKKSEVFRSNLIKTIRNPVNADIFHIKPSDSIKEKYNIPSDKRIILFVAENPDDKRKGFDFLLKSIDKLQDKDQYHLVIIGNTNSFPCIGISCTLLGAIHDENTMSDVYNSANIFIIPSIEDNLPNTVSESLLCGTPVVGYKIGGIAEMVKNNINGYLSAKRGTLENEIETALKQTFDKNNIRTEVLKELNPDQLVLQFENIYKRSVNGLGK